MAGENPTLNVKVRESTGSGAAGRLRRDGMIPGVCYGSGTESFPIAVDPDVLRDVLESGRGRNTLFQLETDTGQDFEHVLLRDYQFHPVKRELTHVDLMVVDADREITVDVPVEPFGEAEAKQMGGKIQVVRPEVPVRCTPVTIPDSIRVDVSGLGPSDAFSAFDLDYPSDVEAAAENDYTVIRVLMPREKVIGLEPTGPEAEEEEGELEEGEEPLEEGEEPVEEGEEEEGPTPDAAPPGA